MKVFRISLTVIFAGFLLVGISACEKEGPAENAGKSIDNAVDSLAESYQEAKDAVQQKGPAEKAGESIDDAFESMGNKYEETKAAVAEKLEE